MEKTLVGGGTYVWMDGSTYIWTDVCTDGHTDGWNERPYHTRHIKSITNKIIVAAKLPVNEIKKNR
jgi:hypothetical protein